MIEFFAETVRLSDKLSKIVQTGSFRHLAEMRIGQAYGYPRQLPIGELTALWAFEAGLEANRVDLRQAVGCAVLPTLVSTLTLLAKPALLEAGYTCTRELGRYIGFGTPWEKLAAGDRDTLLAEGQAVATRVGEMARAYFAYTGGADSDAPAASLYDAKNFDDAEVQRLQQYVGKLMDAVRECRITPRVARDELVELLCGVDRGHDDIVRGRSLEPDLRLGLLAKLSGTP